MKKPKKAKVHYFTLGIRKDEPDYVSAFTLKVGGPGGKLSLSFVKVPTKALQFTTRRAALVAYQALDMFSDAESLDVIEHVQ